MRFEDFAQDAPEVAVDVRAAFTHRVHHMLGTVRADGSPRVSGTEVMWALDELWLGSMWRSPKALDLRRDPRYALHGGSDDPPAWAGDAKIAGVAEEVTDPELFERVAGTLKQRPDERFHIFRLDVTEAVVLRMNGAKDALVVTRWTSDGGVTVRQVA